MQRRNDWNRGIIPPFFGSSHLAGLSVMGPVSFVIAILGCADGGASCQQVAVAPSRFESQAACEAATPGVLSGATDFDFPTIVAQCRSAKSPAAVQRIPARTSGQQIKEG
jgi:hypothetical protein